MRILAIFLFALTMAGCQGGKDFDYQPPDEIPDGPGLFTGEDGKWTVFIPYD